MRATDDVAYPLGLGGEGDAVKYQRTASRTDLIESDLEGLAGADYDCRVQRIEKSPANADHDFTSVYSASSAVNPG